MTSSFLTPTLVYEAIDTLLPAIMRLMEKRGRRSDLHIVVLDPTVKPWNGTFEEAIRFEYQIGNTDEWEHDYMSIARSKAAQAWRTQMPNGVMHLQAAALIESGDVKYISSYVEPWSGIIVGCSGIQDYFDYLIGGWVALACMQFARAEAEKARDAAGDFFV